MSITDINQRIIKLHCVSQQYGWGNYGLKSTVAQLLAGDSQCAHTIDESTPYAELWMGAHPAAPSMVDDLSTPGKLVTLEQYIDANDAKLMLGNDVVERFGTKFPFLFKVLSIRTALSIQAHPDSQLAKQLFKEQPDIYKDSFHKPEIAIALTPFKALCGFRPLQDIVDFVDTKVPELKATIYASPIHTTTSLDHTQCAQYLQHTVKALLKATPEEVANNLKTLVNRIKSQSSRSELDELVLTLHAQYPGDVGVFFAYLLNYIQMKEGEALFLPAGEPHAYVAGDCVECMAPSDNVVRAGLTPKLKDVNTLAKMLTYTTGVPPFVAPIQTSAHSVVYRPPVDEFEVERIDLVGQQHEVSARAVPSILLVLNGSASLSSAHNDNNFGSLNKGTVLFIPANIPFNLQAVSKEQQQATVVYIARVSER
ncbi:hypothetical protein SAMD00019534_121660, partial [Acytostelium subglobosum LB1]|uniref:hypothetical protein n=1 Tax=Acytostelium subglobosum LB1 TaxID=1410327 RepID=UPI0006448C16